MDLKAFTTETQRAEEDSEAHIVALATELLFWGRRDAAPMRQCCTSFGLAPTAHPGLAQAGTLEATQPLRAVRSPIQWASELSAALWVSVVEAA